MYRKTRLIYIHNATKNKIASYYSQAPHIITLTYFLVLKNMFTMLLKCVYLFKMYYQVEGIFHLYEKIIKCQVVFYIIIKIKKMNERIRWHKCPLVLCQKKKFLHLYLFLIWNNSLMLHAKKKTPKKKTKQNKQILHNSRLNYF